MYLLWNWYDDTIFQYVMSKYKVDKCKEKSKNCIKIQQIKSYETSCLQRAAGESQLIFKYSSPASKVKTGAALLKSACGDKGHEKTNGDGESKGQTRKIACVGRWSFPTRNVS